MLVRNIDIIKEYFPNTTVLDIKMLNPFLLAAQEKYLIPYLGVPTYQLLDSYLNDNRQPENPAYDGLLPYAQRVTVYFAYRDSTPLRNLIETTSGYAVPQTSTIAPASKDRTEALKSGAEEFGWHAMEQMLAFLEDRKDDFPEWYNSPVSTLSHRNLVNSSTEFGQYVSLPNFSRMAFQALRSAMDNVENLTIAKVIGTDTLSDVKQKIFTNTVNENQKEIVEYLKRALANLTMHTHIPSVDKAASPYAIFNIDAEVRQAYWLAGMEYLNRAKAALEPPQTSTSPAQNIWQNDPANKIFVFGA